MNSIESKTTVRSDFCSSCRKAVCMQNHDKGDSDDTKATTNSTSGEVNVPTTSEVSSVGTPEQACSNKGNSVVSSTPMIHGLCM